MKRLAIIIILMLSVRPAAVAQQKIIVEEYQYQLFWNVRYVGFPRSQAGEASLVCKKAENNNLILTFHGWGSALGKKVNNFAQVQIDSNGCVQRIYHKLTDVNEEIWQIDYGCQLIYHFSGDSLLDTLRIGDHQPNDALSSIFLLKGNYSPEVGKVDTFYIIGHDSDGIKSAWKPVRIEVKKKAEKKVQEEKIKCWKIRITLDPKDNLFPGGEITLWAREKDLVPVEVETVTSFLLLPAITVRGHLFSENQKDD
ncbi:hypothetical protein KJ840_02675 [Patescibacteria group bacterium]|nr:hypothetical protein [Patescibacteria group bacterium]